MQPSYAICSDKTWKAAPRTCGFYIGSALAIALMAAPVLEWPSAQGQNIPTGSGSRDPEPISAQPLSFPAFANTTGVVSPDQTVGQTIPTPKSEPGQFSGNTILHLGGPSDPSVITVSRDDSATKRFTAMRRDLQAALEQLQNSATEHHGGFVEKAMADVKQALADVDLGLDYLSKHPEVDPPAAWNADDPMHGRSPTPFPPLPNYTGYMLSGRMGLQQRRVGVPDARSVTVATRPFQAEPKIDQNLVQAFSSLRLAANNFVTGPGMNPYQIGNVGGFRNSVREDMLRAGWHIIAALDYAHTPDQPAANGELVVNGDFEAVPSRMGGRGIDGRMGERIANEFGWLTRSGDSFAPGAGPQVVQQGYTNNQSGVTAKQFSAPAYDGTQWVALMGRSANESVPVIFQILPTKPGQRYTLTFAYASSPYLALRGPLHVNSATVSVFDTATETDLIKPFTFSHDSATLENYNWVKHEPMTFTAKSERTTIRFKPDRVPQNVFDALFVDGVSVRAVAPTPAQP